MKEEDIILLVSIITPVASALATLIPVLSATATNRKVLTQKVDLIIRDISRLSMHDEHASLEERITAGDRYIESGGNGASKVYHMQLVDRYKKQLDDSRRDSRPEAGHSK